MRPIINTHNLIIKRLSAWIFLSGPIYLLYLLLLVFVTQILALPDEETLQMLNFSFPFVVGLAAITFSWAQCLKNEMKGDGSDARSPGRIKILKAGKRFFHSAILLLLAILIQYSAFGQTSVAITCKPLLICAKIFVIYSVGLALVFFCMGINAIRKKLWSDETEKPATIEIRKEDSQDR